MGTMKGMAFSLILLAAYGAMVTIAAVLYISPAGYDTSIITSSLGNGPNDIICNLKTCEDLNHNCGLWSDGCGGQLDCGTCNAGKRCSMGTCVGAGGNVQDENCTPSGCTDLGHSCGTWWDNCGGVLKCGDCSAGYECLNGYCIKSTVPDENCTANCTCASYACAGSTCLDGCGGECNGTLQPDCGTRECGSSPNGCGTCGDCTAPETCHGGVCQEGDCVIDCEGRECGTDSCEGSCGTCDQLNGANTCSNGLCSPYCDDGWKSCDGNNVNGCETNIYTDEGSCGTCGYACGTDQTCMGGICIDNYNCTPDCSCSSTTCAGDVCPDGCGNDCDGTLQPDCGTRECGSSPNGCGTCGDCTTGTCTLSGACVNDDLMLRYTFDSISGNIVEDESEYGYNGLMVGGPQVTQGLLGNGMHFNGVDQHVDAGEVTPTGNQLTLSAWFKLDTLAAGADPTILSKSDGDLYPDWALMVYRGGFPEFRVSAIGDDLDASRVYNSLVTVETGKWYHIAGVYNGTHAILYLNCEPIKVKAKTGNLLAASTLMWVGSQPTYSSYQRHFPGTIDDVRVYKRALEPYEIGQIYSQCSTCPPCANPAMTLPPPPSV